MASTTTKRTWADAKADAEAFRDLFPSQCAGRWEFAGSLRRKRPEVSDVEHVVIPAHGDVERGDGLFTTTERVNLLWHHLDALVRGGVVSKHLYACRRADGSEFVTTRWGDAYRGVSFRGFNHEIFTTDADSWGAQLLIRTGSAEYSKRVVTALLDGGMYRQQDGKLIHVGTGDRVPVPDEAAYVRLAGLPYLEPEVRR